ncbi:MAG TPA: hypothetical protein PLZ36_02110 [Armatimonadota bacterium]|nr:hypothetical protein [Armatimonadota bacterium]HOS42397.1 hypothetical protein [Armatimonadota bacterium]
MPYLPFVPRGIRPLNTWVTRVFQTWLLHWRAWLVLGFIYSLGINGSRYLLQWALGTPTGAEEVTRYLPEWWMLAGGGLLPRALLDPGLLIIALKQLRRQPYDFPDLLAGLRVFPAALGAVLLIILLTLGGLALFCIGAIYVVVVSYLALPILVDQRRRPVDAIRQSFAIVNQNIVLFFLYAFTFWALTMLPGGAIASLQAQYPVLGGAVGIAFGMLTLSWWLLAQAVAYDQVFVWNAPASPMEETLPPEEER